MQNIKQNRIKIKNRFIGENARVFIIAEAGINHNGSLRLAKKMIDFAKASGADAIKFQTFKAEELVTISAPKVDYQERSFPKMSQLEMLKKLEFSESDFCEVFKYSKMKKILFLSTPFDSKSAKLLYRLGVSAFKISSGDLTNIPLLLQIAGYGKPIILSTGMSFMKEVKEAVRAIYSTGNRKLILLHCTSNYPVNYKDVNLMAMLTLKKEFKVPVGYSDHTMGIDVSLAAVSLGACVVEKHFTLNRKLPGPDHRASLETNVFRNLVANIRNIEIALGDGLKVPRESELRIKQNARKSIVANCSIPKGTKISPDMLMIKRPGTGIEPIFFNRLINRETRRFIRKDKIITWEKIKI